MESKPPKPRPYIRAGLLSAGKGKYGPVSVSVALDALKLADSRAARVDPDYAMRIQGNTGGASIPQWRTQVVEWLQELAVCFGMDLDTVQTTATIFDRTLSAVAIRPKQLQICALAALFFTVKVLESHPFRAKELEKYFAAIAPPADVTRAERNMLRILDWDVNVFTPVAYVRWLLALVPDERLARDLGASAEILSAWAMLDYDLLRYTTSALGLACVLAACAVRGFDASPLTDLLRASGVTVAVDAALVARLTDVHAREVVPALQEREAALAAAAADAAAAAAATAAAAAAGTVVARPGAGAPPPAARPAAASAAASSNSSSSAASKARFAAASGTADGLPEAMRGGCAGDLDDSDAPNRSLSGLSTTSTATLDDAASSSGAMEDEEDDVGGQSRPPSVAALPPPGRRQQQPLSRYFQPAAAVARGGRGDGGGSSLRMDVDPV